MSTVSTIDFSSVSGAIGIILGVISIYVAFNLPKCKFWLKCVSKWLQRPLEICQKFRIAARLNHGGIIGIYSSRADIEKYRPSPTLADYIKESKYSFTYVGVYQDCHDKIKHSIMDVLEKGCCVEFVILAEDCDSIIMCALASYYSMTTSDLIGHVKESLAWLTNLHKDLPIQFRDKFSILTHTQILTESIMIIDQGEMCEKAFFDIKLFGLIKDQSLSIELQPCIDDNSLYARVISSIAAIKNERKKT